MLVLGRFFFFASLVFARVELLTKLVSDIVHR